HRRWQTPQASRTRAGPLFPRPCFSIENRYQPLTWCETLDGERTQGNHEARWRRLSPSESTCAAFWSLLTVLFSFALAFVLAFVEAVRPCRVPGALGRLRFRAGLPAVSGQQRGHRNLGEARADGRPGRLDDTGLLQRRQHPSVLGVVLDEDFARCQQRLRQVGGC